MITPEQIKETQDRMRSSRSSSYTETQWPTVKASSGVVPSSFQPSTFECLSESLPVVNPMFSDFGLSDATDCDAPHSSGSSELESGHGTIDSHHGIPDGSGQRMSDASGATGIGGHSPGQQAMTAGGVDQATHEAALTQALEEGYARGCADARAEVELYQQQLEERYTVLWEDMQTQLREMTEAHEQQAVELAFQIARRMVGAVVDSQKEYVVSIIKEALQVTGSSEIKTVRVSPQDFEFLQLGGYGERIKIHGDKKLAFESDESIRSGCIVVTNSGEIDFDLDKAWARMHEKALQGPRS